MPRVHRESGSFGTGSNEDGSHTRNRTRPHNTNLPIPWAAPSVSIPLRPAGTGPCATASDETVVHGVQMVDPPMFPRLSTMAGMSVDSDGLWDAFVDVMLVAGHMQEGRSRYGDKPALLPGGRETPPLGAEGGRAGRTTGGGWARARQGSAADPAVLRDPGRRDWIELRP